MLYYVHLGASLGCAFITPSSFGSGYLLTHVYSVPGRPRCSSCGSGGPTLLCPHFRLFRASSCDFYYILFFFGSSWLLPLLPQHSVSMTMMLGRDSPPVSRPLCHWCQLPLFRRGRTLWRWSPRLLSLRQLRRAHLVSLTLLRSLARLSPGGRSNAFWFIYAVQKNMKRFVSGWLVPPSFVLGTRSLGQHHVGQGGMA